MKYVVLFITLCAGVTLFAASSTEVPLAEAHDNNAPPVTLDIPEEKKAPLLTPYVTMDGKRAEWVSTDFDAQYAIIPRGDELPDPLDNSEETNTDSQWELLAW